MATFNTKAGKLLGSISETSVEEWDQLLKELAESWTVAYTNRHVRALMEGNTTPPPSPPQIPLGLAGNSAVAGARRDKSEFAGMTVRGLADRYREDPQSTYHALRFRTRAHYDGQIKKILQDTGDAVLADLTVDDVQGLYESWSGDGHVSMGHSLITILRVLINFGATVLEDPACERLSGALRRIKFDRNTNKRKAITAAQAIAIRMTAHERYKPSIALAQALQFDCKIAQIDLVGEWVPISEAGNSEIISKEGDTKWLRGLRWNQINDNLVLKYTSERTSKEIEIDLRSAPMVMEELEHWKPRPSYGPLILCESSRLPWIANEFRRWWRKLARECGIPDDVHNADSSLKGDGHDVGRPYVKRPTPGLI